jgi:uncharacterized protein
MMRHTLPSAMRPIRRVLVLGDGRGQQSQPTGAERQALSLASALLRSSVQREAVEADSPGWRVHAKSLTAVGVPMPRLFRPLPAGLVGRLVSRIAGDVFLSIPTSARSTLLAGRIVAGEELPSPFNDPASDFSDTIIIAAGSATAAAAIVRRQQMPNSKLIKFLHPRGELKLFDVVVTPSHDFEPNASLPDNVVTTKGSLHDIALDKLASHQSSSPSEDILALPRPRVTALLGGPRAHLLHRSRGWSNSDAAQLSRMLAGLAGAQGSVLLTISRRTPPAFGRRLQLELHTLMGMKRVLFDDGALRSRYLYLLATSDALVVTRDSVNMISEAMASNAQLFVAGYSGSTRLERFISNLVAENQLTLLEMDGKTSTAKTVPMAAEAACLRRETEAPPVELEVDRVARIVLGHLENAR